MVAVVAVVAGAVGITVAAKAAPMVAAKEWPLPPPLPPVAAAAAVAEILARVNPLALGRRPYRRISLFQSITVTAFPTFLTSRGAIGVGSIGLK